MDQQPVPPTNTPPTNFVPPAPLPPAGDPVTPAPAANEVEGVPSAWPGAFGVYKYSKRAVKQNLGTLVVLWLIDIVLGGGAEIVLKQPGRLVAILIGPIFGAALILVLLGGVRNQRVSIGQALSQALPLWLRMIGLEILVYLSMVVSFVLLVIPFFFVMPRLILSYYFLVDQRQGVIEAYKSSWAATKGNVGKVYGIIGAGIAMALLMITIIGIPFAIYFLVMYSAAAVVLYEFITKSGAQPVPQAAPGMPAMAATPPAQPIGPPNPVVAPSVNPMPVTNPEPPTMAEPMAEVPPTTEPPAAVPPAAPPSVG